MTVVDASALVTALAGTGDRALIADDAIANDDLAAPAMVRVEALSALRGIAASGEIDDATAARRLRQLGSLPITLFPIEPHLPRVWDLRHNVTPYDAWYIAVAEALDAPLLTTDTRLARAPGIRCEVRVV